MALIAPQNVTKTGGVITFTAASTSDTVEVRNPVTVLVRTGTAAAQVVTVSTYPDTSPQGTTIPDLTFTVGDNAERALRLTPSENANPTTGLATISTPTTTGLSYAVLAV